MNILIIAATKQEVSPLLDKYRFQYNAVDNIYSDTSGKKVNVLISGIGMTAMAFAMGKYTKQYDFALNAGIAGSFNPNYKIGDVVNVTTDIISELGAEDEEKFLSIEEMGLEGSWTHDARSRESGVGSEMWENEIISQLPRVKGITVNTVHGNEESIKKIVDRLNPDIESMEGAAFMYACKELKIPHAQVRAISNYVEKRNKDNWNIPLAIANLNNTLIQIIESL